MLSDIKVPNTKIVRQAEELARSTSSDLLFNHVMRSYWFSELLAQRDGTPVDHELMFLSAVLHDLGLTEVGGGPHRFEIEGANAARRFLMNHGVSSDRAWRVWDNIALHVWDVNLFRDDTSRLLELGIRHDVRGLSEPKLDPLDVAEVLGRYPRLGFKRGFYNLLSRELERKQPYEHCYHLCTCVANSQAPLSVPDAQAMLNGAPFED
jgi:hypothetical protein